MRKFILFILPILGWVGSMQATIGVEARGAYFLPQDSRMRDIYGNGFSEWELEATTSLDCLWPCAPCGLEAFANLGYFQKKGTSTCTFEHDRTKVKNWAFNLGLVKTFDTCFCFRPYLGLGFGAVHVNFHDESEFVKSRTNKWGACLLAKSGLKYDVTCNLFLDMFVDYSYHWFCFKKRNCAEVRNVNTGGLLVGLGLGYQF